MAVSTIDPNGLNIGQIGGTRNKIINGAMVIDQRNAGAAVTPTTTSYTLDRWQATLTQSSKFTLQQNAGSVTPPTGFTNYLGVTSLSSYAVGASDAFRINQVIEGFNTADLSWGTAGAVPITVSFWVRSSLTGTFGAQILNHDATRAYPFTYSISSANTWEKKTVTIPGDTTGTWVTNNTASLYLGFGLGYGTSLSGTANAWNAGTAFMPTGAVSVVGTSGATFYLTGVQLEAGDTATPFEHRSYGQELALCQRYCYVGRLLTTGNCDSGGNPNVSAQLPVLPRATPTLVSYGGSWRGAIQATISNLSVTSSEGVTVSLYSTDSGTINALVSGFGGNVSYTFSMEL